MGEQGSSLLIIRLEDESAVEQDVVCGNDLDHLLSSQASTGTEFPEDSRITQYNMAELIAQVRQRDSAYDDLNPATASHNSLPEAERGIVTTVTETNQNQVGIHGRAYLAAATDNVATDDRVWNWRKSTKLCLQLPRGNDADQRVVCDSAGIAHSNESRPYQAPRHGHRTSYQKKATVAA